MMSSKQGTLLLALVSLWAVLIVWQWFMQDDPQRVPLTNISSAAKASPQETAVPSEWVLNPPKDLRESPSVPKRNLFAPLSERQEQLMLAQAKHPIRRDGRIREGVPAAIMITQSPVAEGPPPPAPLQTSSPRPQAPQPSPQEVADLAARQEREQRIGKLREQASQYRLLGLAERGGVKQAFVGKGTDIYIVRQGDTLDGLFMVSIVDAGEVKIRDAEYHLEHTIKINKDAGPS